MFVTKARYARMEAEARACSAMAQALAEQLHTAAAQRDEARMIAEHAIRQNNDFQTKITELNEAIEDRDQQIRQLNTQIQQRGERGRFVKKTAA